MNRKLPNDAFGLYLAMGPERPYSALAKQLGVNKRTVTPRAPAEKWQDRVAEIERKAREQTDKKAVETIEAMNTRHLRSLNAVFARALEALREHPLDTGMDAVRAIALVIKEERSLRGDGSERSETVIAQTTREELGRLLVTDGEDGR
ncbi:MAG: hypothetical protein IPJ77_11295 [Planctomycetes bacterium]|nr:hypothetical protein [Planctomycetota bacterium]